jgi:hypothetical protein
MKKFITVILALSCAIQVFSQTASLVRQGDATQLFVEGKPFLILGGELGNSSAACFEDIEANFDKLLDMEAADIARRWRLYQALASIDYSLPTDDEA